MSGVEESSHESVEVKENNEFDDDVEDQLEDDYAVDPTRYIFYRYCLLGLSPTCLGG